MSDRCAPLVPSRIAALAALSLLLSPHVATSVLAQQRVEPGAAADGKSAIAPHGERKAVREIKYGDWQKFCFDTPGSNNTVCRTSIAGTWDTGQSAVRADLIEREGEAKARLQLFLPVGLYLPAGVKLTVDRGKPYQLPYVWCMTNTCIAGSVADPQLVQDMESGEKLTLEIVDSSVQTLSTSLPLNQFATVRKAAPARTFQQDLDE
ncbi:invasion associated locus B family protein [Bradyrhizobium sp. dw_411]|uniref:invasion associated locus B family protein n=1 Tax=Bradyrhizobium sp. dw_411 TaxID=2720082 RepID=UPI001BCC533B|nr:invasion associated locus B family protein [Bradyrhizobium sp. dw_411]